MPQVKVTDADRGRAADYMSERDYDWGYCGDVRAGRVEHPLPAHFARHRIAALEDAAKVADRRAAFYAKRRDDPHLSEPARQLADHKYDTAANLATAIRTLKGSPR